MDPMQKPKLTPKDFFLYAGAMITLYWSAGALIALLFAIVDTVFRDALTGYLDPYSGGIRFAIASLIVVFPISLFLFTIIKRAAVAEPQKFLLPFRRWLYALTLFITAGALLGDLIALINGFLGGELTARFVYKALSVLVVAGAVFWFCLLEIKVKPESPRGVRKGFLIGAALIVLASIVYGFVVMGSPSTIRRMRFDERRVSDLSTIQWQVVNFWQQKGRIPKTLAELEDPISGFKAPIDPTTGAAYEYAAKGGTAFELCAVFSAASVANDAVKGLRAPYPMDGNDSWTHKDGRFCFERTIDPERYPIQPKNR